MLTAKNQAKELADTLDITRPSQIDLIESFLKTMYAKGRFDMSADLASSVYPQKLKEAMKPMR